MTEFAFEDGVGTGSYETGLLTLPDGGTHGIEAVAVRRTAPAETGPDLLGTLRSVLPAPANLAMPLRLAVSTVRAGLGAIGDELGAEREARIPVEIVLDSGEILRARMPARLAQTMERDRALVRAALARAADRRPRLPEAVTASGPELGEMSPEEEALPEGPAEALTSIFRYEKRNGRLRRVSESGPASE